MKKWLKKSTISEDTIPNWLYQLPVGEYSIMQVCKKTGQSYQNIYRRFNALQVPTRTISLREYREKHEADLKVHRWLTVTIYIWEGYEPYLDRILQRKLKKKSKKELGNAT